jgi:hypothetical protein
LTSGELVFIPKFGLFHKGKFLFVFCKNLKNFKKMVIIFLKVWTNVFTQIWVWIWFPVPWTAQISYPWKTGTKKVLGSNPTTSDVQVKKAL